MKPFSGQHEDACPSWARQLIEQIRQIEIKLGNIPPDQLYSGDDLDEMQARAARAGSVHDDDEQAEALFVKLCKGLLKEGHAPQSIAGFVNVRIGYEGGPPYCSAAEVVEADGR